LPQLCSKPLEQITLYGFVLPDRTICIRTSAQRRQTVQVNQYALCRSCRTYFSWIGRARLLCPATETDNGLESRNRVFHGYLRVRMNSPRVNPKYKIIAVLCFAALFFLLRFGWSILSPTPSEMSSGLPSVAIEIGILSLFWAVAMVFLKPATLPNYKLLVDEESITWVTEYTGWMRWFVTRRTVRKSRVRTIFEIKATGFHSGGLGISERSMLGIRMWGCVFLPKDLPEYDDLRRLVEGWRSVESLPSE
jgi:hypothetical protein